MTGAGAARRMTSQRACIDVLGNYDHRRVALQEVRFAVEDATRGQDFEHRLRDFNNLPQTTLTTDIATGTFNGIWGAGESDVFAVGLGDIRHYDGSAWTAMTVPTTNPLTGDVMTRNTRSTSPEFEIACSTPGGK